MAVAALLETTSSTEGQFVLLEASLAVFALIGYVVGVLLPVARVSLSEGLIIAGLAVSILAGFILVCTVVLHAGYRRLVGEAASADLAPDVPLARLRRAERWLGVACLVGFFGIVLDTIGRPSSTLSAAAEVVLIAVTVLWALFLALVIARTRIELRGFARTMALGA